jgi:stringent starvation protein B
MAETSTKPYMIRALHEWCTDNGYTPHIVVKVDANTMVPHAHIQNGQITLNIGSLATNRLVIGNEVIEFQARFSGVTENIYVPVSQVTAVYARETGAGMGFEIEEGTAQNISTASFAAGLEKPAPSHAETKGAHTPEPPTEPDPKRPKLSIVK